VTSVQQHRYEFSWKNITTLFRFIQYSCIGIKHLQSNNSVHTSGNSCSRIRYASVLQTMICNVSLNEARITGTSTTCAGILKQSKGARNRVAIWLSYRAGIFKQSMGARNRVGIGPPGYIDWRNSFFGIKRRAPAPKIQALFKRHTTD
jgi:hypothetical protein